MSSTFKWVTAKTKLKHSTTLPFHLFSTSALFLLSTYLRHRCNNLTCGVIYDVIYSAYDVTQKVGLMSSGYKPEQ